MIEKTVRIFLKHKWLTTLLLLIATGVILFLTLMPPNEIGDHSIYQYDKLGHFMMFFGWTLLFGLISFSLRGVNRTPIIAIFFIGSLFGVGIEIAQGLMPHGRTASLYDAIADILGSMSAALLLLYIRSRLTKPVRKRNF